MILFRSSLFRSFNLHGKASNNPQYQSNEAHTPVPTQGANSSTKNHGCLAHILTHSLAHSLHTRGIPCWTTPTHFMDHSTRHRLWRRRNQHSIGIHNHLKDNADGLSILKQKTLDVSDPTSSSYGQHLSIAEINTLTAPPIQNINTITTWLKRNNIENINVIIDTKRDTDTICSS